MSILKTPAIQFAFAICDMCDIEEKIIPSIRLKPT